MPLTLIALLDVFFCIFLHSVPIITLRISFDVPTFVGLGDCHIHPHVA